MLRENNSLTYVQIGDDVNYNDINASSQKKINTLLKINRDWKKFNAMSAVLTMDVNAADANANANANANTDENNADVDDDGDGDDDDNDDNDDNDENDENDDAVDDDDGAENSKLKSKKKTLVHMYLKKPIMRDTITCILLKEYKLGLIHDANYIKKGNENGIFFV